MKRLLVLILLALSLPAVAAPAAHAGCLAQGGAVQFFSGYTKANGYMNCTTNNGSSYEMRIYVQGSDGGAGYVSRTPAVRFTINSPANNTQYARVANFSCGYYSAIDTTLRTKVVVQNNATGSTDVDVGPSYTRPSACQ